MLKGVVTLCNNLAGCLVMSQVEVEALGAQAKELRGELETLRIRETPRDRVGSRDSPPRRGRRRSRGAHKKTIRCFRCAEIGHYGSDCCQDPDPDFPGWRYGNEYRRTRGGGRSRESRTTQGDRNKGCPRGLGPGTSVKPWVPSGGVHPLVIQCYHCYEFWHRDRDDPGKRRPSLQSSEEWKPEDTAAEPSPTSPR